MAFYQCPKCKRVWQYPIEKCPDCFLNLEGMKSKKIKVIGVSKVNIPTLFHPKVPYFVLILEDENGNKWVQKFTPHRTCSDAGSAEYKIGDVFNVTGQDLVTKDAVAIWRIKYDILEGIEKVVELLGGIDVIQEAPKDQAHNALCARPTGQAKILILPTLTSPKHPYFAENTSPQFLKSLIKYLTERGAKLENIKVSGQSFDEIPIEASAQKSQLLRVCQGFKILPLDLAKTNFVKKAPHQGIGGGFEISEEVFNSDLIINLPILKMGKISATENVLKFLKKENYLGLKYLYSAEEIIENLNKALPQCLTLAEAQSVQKPDQFITHLNLVFASFNSLNLDRVFAEVSMAKELPEYLKKVKIEDIPIIGRKVEEVQYDLEKS